MKKKKVLIITIIIVVVILIIATGLAFAYYTTDFLKTDKQLFFKYFSQINDISTEFQDEDLTKYFEKEKITPYENAGKLSVQMKLPSNEEILKRINELNITFDGKVDKLNNKKEQHLKINYSDNVNFPVDYKHTDNLYALGSNIVANKYVAIRNENLQELLSKMGILSEDFGITSNKIKILEEMSEISEMSLENLRNILDKCYEILKQDLKDSNFSKINNNKFTLSLTEQEVEKIYMDLIEILKNEGILSESVNQQLDEMNKQLEKSNNTINSTKKDALNITIYQKNGRLSQVEINMSGNILTLQILNGKITVFGVIDNKDTPRVSIEKIKNDNELEYLVSYKMEQEDNNMDIYFKCKYGDLTTQNVTENYVFGLSQIYTDIETQELSELKYEYTLDITKEFSSEIEIEDLSANTALILNDKDSVYIQNTLNAIGNKIAQLNKEQMTKIGLNEFQNPLIMATPIGMVINDSMKLLIVNQQNVQQQQHQREQEEQEQLRNLQTMINQIINEKFEQYAGKQVTGSEVRKLLKQVLDTIAEEPEQITTIVYNDQSLTPKKDIIENIRNVINTMETYKVSFGYDNVTHLINSITIKMNYNPDTLTNSVQQN